MEKAHEAQILALPRVSSERHRRRRTAEGLPGPDWVAKIKSTAKEALSEASGERLSIKPAQALAFRATRGKAVPCLVTILRHSSPQWDEDLRTNADPSLNPFSAETAPILKGPSRPCSEMCARRPLQVATVPAPTKTPATVGGPDFLHQHIPAGRSGAGKSRDLLPEPLGPQMASMWTAENRDCL